MLRSLTPMLLLGWTLGLTASAQESADELVAREKVRSDVEAALGIYLQPISDGTVRLDNAIRAVERFEQIGPEAIPYLVNELEQDRPETFDFVAYALGRLASPESEAGLRQAIERAEAGVGDWAMVRKAWAAWALGLQGQVDALVLLSQGNTGSATFPMHAGTSTFEAVAIQTAPESLSVVLGVLGDQLEDPELWNERRASLRALQRIGDPAAVEKIVPLLRHEDRITRREAANTLAVMGNTAGVTDALLGAMEDEDESVRRSVALALEQVRPTGKMPRILARLEPEAELDALTRGAFYRLIADLQGPGAVDTLQRFAGHHDSADRRQLVKAMGRIGDARAVEFLGKALRDPVADVALEAVLTLSSIRSEEAVATLTAGTVLGNWVIAQEIPEQLARIGAIESGAAIARRLERELSEDVTETRVVYPLKRMAEALVDLRHVEALEFLPRALESQTHHMLVPALERTIRLLQTIKAGGRKTSRWIEHLGSEDESVRELAYARLAELGGDKAANALTTGFEDAPRKERLMILRALGDLRAVRSTALIERVLLDPEFDPVDQSELRDMAAWSARRIGGEAMVDLLERSVRRRHGRDARPMVYLAVLGGERFLPLLEEFRKKRMQYLGWARGNEQKRLEWIGRRIESGLSLVGVDRPPEGLIFR